MNNTRSRLTRVERILAEHDKEPDMLFLNAVPDEYPDPVPPGYHRKSEIEKMDLSAYSFVLVSCMPPADYEERKRAAEAVSARPQKGR